MTIQDSSLPFESENIKDILREISLNHLDHFEQNVGESINLVELNKILNKAERENCSEVYMELGEIHRFGRGVKKDNQLAFDYFKKAAKMGCVDGYIKMIRTLLETNAEDQIEAQKCWASYFKDIRRYVNSKPEKINEFHLLNYIDTCLRNNFYVEHKDILSEFRYEMIRAARSLPSKDFSDVIKFIITSLEPGHVEKEPFKGTSTYIFDNKRAKGHLFGNLTMVVSIERGRVGINDKIRISTGTHSIEIVIDSINFDENFSHMAHSGTAFLSFTGDFEDFMFIKDEATLKKVVTPL